MIDHHCCHYLCRRLNLLPSFWDTESGGLVAVTDSKLFSESLVHTSEGEDGRCQGDQREGSFKVSGEGTVPNTWMFKLIIWIFNIGVFCTLLTWRNELKRILQISGMFFNPCPVYPGYHYHWSSLSHPEFVSYFSASVDRRQGSHSCAWGTTQPMAADFSCQQVNSVTHHKELLTKSIRSSYSLPF